MDSLMARHGRLCRRSKHGMAAVALPVSCLYSKLCLCDDDCCEQYLMMIVVNKNCCAAHRIQGTHSTAAAGDVRGIDAYKSRLTDRAAVYNKLYRTRYNISYKRNASEGSARGTNFSCLLALLSSLCVHLLLLLAHSLSRACLLPGATVMPGSRTSPSSRRSRRSTTTRAMRPPGWSWVCRRTARLSRSSTTHPPPGWQQTASASLHG